VLGIIISELSTSVRTRESWACSPDLITFVGIVRNVRERVGGNGQARTIGRERSECSIAHSHVRYRFIRHGPKREGPTYSGRVVRKHKPTKVIRSGLVSPTNGVRNVLKYQAILFDGT
jgi:hypothetical protein